MQQGRTRERSGSSTPVNTGGTSVLLQALIDHPVERLVVASSMSVYGEGLYTGPDGGPATPVERTREQFAAGAWEPLAADGATLTPVPTPETKPPSLSSVSLNVAKDLGYGDDTWTMSRDHEIGHTWLAHLNGLPWSPTMWRLAHPKGSDVLDDAKVAEEEATVLAFQATLVKDEPRPWDVADVPAKEALPW